MTTRRITIGILALAVFLTLVPGIGSVGLAWADRPSVSMFYEALAPYGTWIDYGKYGPVWYPTKVSSSWRPYLDGRWVPSRSGWVFETSEPWGWATYHYGNWMPTTEYGWVWSPGSTWYPSTAAWRTSDDYIGWAPVPPSDYVPEPAFYPAGGYNAEAPIIDQMAAPLWIFAKAAEFLLGFGEPYSEDYSYYNGYDILAPFSYAPIVYGGTFLLTDFYYPVYAPSAFFCFGPPFAFVSRVCHRNFAEFNTFVNRADFARMRNVLPPALVAERFPFIRNSIPLGVREGRGFAITRVSDVARAERALNHGGVIPAPAGLPALSKSIPKASPAVEPKALGSIKGMSLPRQAQRTLTPTMRQQIDLQRRQGLPSRVETRPEFRPLGKPLAAPKLPEVLTAPGRTTRKAPGPVAPGVTPGAPSREFHPATPRVTPGTPSREVHPPLSVAPRPAPSREFRAPVRERGPVAPAPAPTFRMPSARPSVPHEFRAAPPPVYHAAPRPAPTFHAPAPAPRSAPAPRAVSPAPAPAPRGSAPSRTGSQQPHR